MLGELYMSGLKKVFIIFTVAIVLATISNVFLSKADATSEDTTNTTNVVANENVNNIVNTNTTPATTQTTNTNVVNNTNVDNNAVNNTNVATNTENVVDWSKIRNTLPVGSTSSSGTLPKTGSNFTLKNTFLGIVVIATALLVGITVYNKKVGMTDETK